MDNGTWISQLRKGIAEYVVLLTLRNREAYGYEILRDLTGMRHFAFGESTLYPLLGRLTRDGFLAVRTEASPHGPRRRYYRLTPAGNRRLEELGNYWSEMVEAVSSLRKETR